MHRTIRARCRKSWMTAATPSPIPMSWGPKDPKQVPQPIAISLNEGFQAARLDPEQGRRRVRVHDVCLVFRLYDAPPNYPRRQHRERMFRMIWRMMLLAWLASSA